MIDATWQSLGRTTLPEKSTKRFWFNNLQKFSLGDVSVAFAKYIDTAPEVNGVYKLPVLKDIKRMCAPLVEKSLPPPPLSRDRNAEYSKRIQAFVAENLTAVKDHKAWAKRVVENPSQYPSQTVSRAEKALSRNGRFA